MLERTLLSIVEFEEPQGPAKVQWNLQPELCKLENKLMRRKLENMCGVITLLKGTHFRWKGAEKGYRNIQATWQKMTNLRAHISQHRRWPVVYFFQVGVLQGVF